MSRSTQAIAYVNSSPEEWKKGAISENDFTHLSISDNVKLYRRWYRHGKEYTFKQFLENLEKKMNGKKNKTNSKQ